MCAPSAGFEQRRVKVKRRPGGLYTFNPGVFVRTRTRQYSAWTREIPSPRPMFSAVVATP